MQHKSLYKAQAFNLPAWPISAASISRLSNPTAIYIIRDCCYLGVCDGFCKLARPPRERAQSCRLGERGGKHSLHSSLARGGRDTNAAGWLALNHFGALLNCVNLPHMRWRKKRLHQRDRKISIHTRESELEKICDARRRTNKLIWPDTTLLMRGLIFIRYRLCLVAKCA